MFAKVHLQSGAGGGDELFPISLRTLSMSKKNLHIINTLRTYSCEYYSALYIRGC